METPKLLPCPFCGRPPDLRFWMADFKADNCAMFATIECWNDNCLIPKVKGKIGHGYSLKMIHKVVENIAEKWNTRAPVVNADCKEGDNT